jgi:hypothetical protein
MAPGKTLVERALELAREGRWRSATRIKTLLKREGYIGVEAAFNRPEFRNAVEAALKAAWGDRGSPA